MASPSLPHGRSLAMAFLLFMMIFAALLAAAPAASAGNVNYLAGSACTGGPTPRWQSGDTWILYGNVTVPTGCILTIEPGAIIKADPAVRLYVNGQLQANGTSASYITFDTNVTNQLWGGIQFNQSSRASYLQYASLLYADRGVRAVQNPLFAGPTLQNDFIDHAVVGVELEGSNATLRSTRINYTSMAVRATTGGSPVIVTNTITTVLGNPAIAIYATNLDTPVIQQNTIRWVNASNGGDGVLPGAAGQLGGFAIGILVNASAWPVVAGNTIDQILAGRGGNGQGSLGGNGGRGGDGGMAAAIAVASSPRAQVQTNRISNVLGGHGGNGGASASAGSSGGSGGSGGAAFAADILDVTIQGWVIYNQATGIVGGSAGDGGNGVGGATVGKGGLGAAAYGYFLTQVVDANVSNNQAQTFRGGYGGNGSAGGVGGETVGILLLGVDGLATIRSNTITGLTGGVGGGGNRPTAAGGNATGVLVLGIDSNFNLTSVVSNQISGITGGVGGVAGLGGSVGGGATGLAVLQAQLDSRSNLVQTITGGQGGSTAPGQPVGQGGSASGTLAALIASGTSSSDRVQSITRGAPGTGGTPVPAAYGIGFYALGNKTVTSTVLLANATFATVSDCDLYLDNYTETTALNSTFSSSKLVLMPAANLTVQNFLAVRAFWPNNVTPVLGVRFAVTDNGNPVYNRTSATGAAQWIPVTNREYINSNVPTWNTTQVAASYLSYSFANSPRTVNMTASQTQYFTMVDSTPPTSSANSLPTWTATRSFTVHYTYSDANGVGVANVTLWYRLNATAWVAYATQTAAGGGTGQFAFVAPADGTYEFATTAVDRADNAQVPTPPTANNTWTIVDTLKPASHVNALPTWETTLSFLVTWGPDAGVTDVVVYTVEYNTGTGWTPWFGDTTLTSSTFTATGQGVYQFRTLAWDYAGNQETKTGNDTWTIVDTIAPVSSVSALPAYEAATTFTVAWAPVAPSVDIANYTLQVSADGGPWSTWFAGATNGSATFAGVDGHRYAFRSLATDVAGNRESKTGNDTWTIVDVTAPSSSVNSLPQYETSPSISISWGPAGATADVATYTIQVSTDGGAWTNVAGSVNTIARSATFAGADGHRYAFRSLATDVAGNTETKSANDTWTIVDATRPTAVSGIPEGAGVNTTPSIVITFTEPMDPLSTQQAFALTPAMDGAFSWSGGGTVLTFTPARPLEPGTTYAAVLGTTATDLAGNPLSALKTFTFTTAAAAGPAGLNLAELWPILLAVILAVVGGILFMLYRRRTASEAADAVPAPAAPSPAPAAIDDVFLLYGRDGVLIKHETRRLRPDIDTDILSGMLTAVQQFVKDSFRGEDGEELNEMTVGQMHILIGRGKWIILAATMSGGDVDFMNDQMKRCIQDMEDHNWDRLEDWDGDMEIAKALSPYLKKLIRGEYANMTVSLTRAAS